MQEPGRLQEGEGEGREGRGGMKEGQREEVEGREGGGGRKGQLESEINQSIVRTAFLL